MSISRSVTNHEEEVIHWEDRYDGLCPLLAHKEKIESRFNFNLGSSEAKKAYIIGRLLLCDSVLNPTGKYAGINLNKFFGEIADFSSHLDFVELISSDIANVFRLVASFDIRLKRIQKKDDVEVGLLVLFPVVEDEEYKTIKNENEELKKEVKRLKRLYYATGDSGWSV